mmetsp:Transcript_19383/g.42138  ORF Transcript_19383/g.42138 Transcript_19383/m.42138 type:complete len:260 (-) Transcript_19383:186-965(-)
MVFVIASSAFSLSTFSGMPSPSIIAGIIVVTVIVIAITITITNALGITMALPIAFLLSLLFQFLFLFVFPAFRSTPFAHLFIARISSAVFNHDALQRDWAVLLSALDIHHFPYRFHARDDFSENNVLPIQVRCRLECHEELRTVGVRFPRIRHANDPFSVVFVGFSFFVVPIATVQRTEAPRTVKSFPITGLNTKPGHHAMKFTSAVGRLGSLSVRSNCTGVICVNFFCRTADISIGVVIVIRTKRQKRSACFGTIDRV